VLASRKVVFRKGCTEEDGALRKCSVNIFSEGASPWVGGRKMLLPGEIPGNWQQFEKGTTGRIRAE